MSSPNPVPPIERRYDLGDISQAGSEIRIGASADDLARIAEWAEVDAVTKFEAVITLKRLSDTRFDYDAELHAQIVQKCVVTLEPVQSEIDRSVQRRFLVTGRRADPASHESLTSASADDETLEEIASTRSDLAAPLLEEFSLAIDPYPRAPGVAFEAKPEPDSKPESPFAVLGRLKERGGKKG